MITVQTIPLFQSSVAYGKIFGFDKKNLINEILKLETTAESNFRSNAGGYQSTSFDIKFADNAYSAELFNDTIITRMWGTIKYKQEIINTILNDYNDNEYSLVESIIDYTLEN
jgi:hypothetical protein